MLEHALVAESFALIDKKSSRLKGEQEGQVQAESKVLRELPSKVARASTWWPVTSGPLV